MKRLRGILALGILAGCTMASAQKVDSKRVDAIWDFAVDRINRQTDDWFELGDFPRVINLVRIMYALYPADFEIATNLGWMLENIQKWDEALAVYIKYRTENPKDPDAAWPEANFYFAKKLYPKIPPILEPTLKMATHPHPNNYRTLAHAYERMDQLADAQRIWKIYLRLAPSDEPAKNNLARVEKKLRGAPTGKSG
jgi:tetratricopeptide (TPR) repeat protein